MRTRLKDPERGTIIGYDIIKEKSIKNKYEVKILFLKAAIFSF